MRTGDFSVDAGEEQAHSLLAEENPPTAIFCFSDETAIGAMVALRQRGLACPGDVSIAKVPHRRARPVDRARRTVARNPDEQ